MLKNPLPKSVSWHFGNIKDRLLSYENSHTSFFIACFCENGDLLSQWRAYGSNGGGYSIGVYPNVIGLKPRFGTPDFDVRPVIYERKKQIHLINSLLEVTKNQIVSNNYKLNEIRKSNLASEYLYHFIDYLLIFKDPSFKEEKEWRLIILADIDKVQFRKWGFRSGPN